jgi:hypothetical protein
MKCFRLGLRLGVVVLFCALVFLHILRGPPKALTLHGGASSGGGRSSGVSSLSHASSGDAKGVDAPSPGGSSSGRPRRAYKQRLRPIVYPSTVYAEKSPDGGYQTYLWTDGFLKDSAITIIAQCYVGLPRTYEDIKLRSPLFPGGEVGLTTIHVRDAYESVIVARYESPSLEGLDRLEMQVVYQDRVSQNVTVLRAPGGWESSFAMCALFLQDRHLLRMWTAYWYLIGVDTFYLYWNGDTSVIPELRDMVEDLPATVVFIHWPYDYWVPNKERPHHGQPQAWNSCYQRNKDKHDYLVFYDLVRVAVIGQAPSPILPSLTHAHAQKHALPPPSRMSSLCSTKLQTLLATTTACLAPGWLCVPGAPGQEWIWMPSRPPLTPWSSLTCRPCPFSAPLPTIRGKSTF